jgi:hypothetical protein
VAQTTSDRPGAGLVEIAGDGSIVASARPPVKPWKAANGVMTVPAMPPFR